MKGTENWEDMGKSEEETGIIWVKGDWKLELYG